MRCVPRARSKAGRLGFRDRVGETVIDPRSVKRVHVAEIIDLQARRAARDDPGTGFVTVAVEIDQNIDAVAADPLGGFFVVHRREIDEDVDRICGSYAFGTAIVRVQGIADDLEATAIVRFE